MASATPTPLEKSREDALSFLTRLVLWAFAPLALMTMGVSVLVIEPATARHTVAVVVPPVALVVVVALLLRPAPGRSLRLRGAIAVTLMFSLAGWGLLFNGPRALNAVSAVIALALAVLFSEDRRGARRFVVGASIAIAALVIVRRFPWLALTVGAPATTLLADVVAITLTLLGGCYVAFLLWRTLENFRDSQRALEERGRQLFDAQAAAQHLLRQELLARLATSIAGSAAGELDALHSAHAEPKGTTVGDDVAHLGEWRRVREAGARVSQTLRLLESLGQTGAAHDHGSNLRDVMARVQQTLQPITPYGHTLDLLTSVTSRPLMEPARLEQLIVYLALRLKQQYPTGTGVVVRAYEGLGDVSRTDGRRTWTILDIGRTFDGTSPPHDDGGAKSASGVEWALAEEALAAVGGRLDREQRDDGVFLVLQLPSR